MTIFRPMEGEKVLYPTWIKYYKDLLNKLRPAKPFFHHYTARGAFFLNNVALFSI